jgi:homoserine kinase type II
VSGRSRAVAFAPREPFPQGEAVFEPEELQALSDEYGLGRIASIVRAPQAWMRRGNHQQNFVVDAGRSKYLFRFDRGKGELEVKREVDLLLYLRKHDFPCPQPLADRKSRHYRSIAGACLTAFKYIDGRAPHVVQLNHAQIENVGRALAELHLVGKGYKKGIDNRFSFERVAELYAGMRTQLPHYFKKITRTLDEETEYLANYLETKLPKGVINGDLLEENVLVKGDKLVAMLDFDAACRGKFIFDLATAVNAICFIEGRYDLKRFEALIAGYESLRTLSLAEWDAFPNELRFSALRFTVTRLREVLAFPSAELGLAAITEERIAATPASDDDRGKRLEEDRARAVKGFQEFFDRLSILRRERDGGMEPMLLAMATGYDYRKYQKVKAVERRGAKA